MRLRISIQPFGGTTVLPVSNWEGVWHDEMPKMTKMISAFLIPNSSISVSCFKTGNEWIMVLCDCQ